MSGLFRQEVVESQLTDMGVPLRITSAWMRFFMLLFLIFCLGIAATVYLGSYTRKASVKGVLLPDKGIVQISSPRDGRIRTIHVAEGQQVAAGDLLFTIDVSAESISGNTIEATYQNLIDRKLLIEQELDLSNSIALTEKINLAHRIERKRQEVSVSEQEAKTHVQNIDALEDVLQRKRDLNSRSLATSDVVADARKELLEAQIDAITQEQALLRLRNELSALKDEFDNFDQKHASTQVALKEDALTIQRQITDLDDQRAILVRAPSAGTVTHVASTVGSAVDPDTVMIRLVPEDSTLEALLLIPSKDAGFVRTGTRIKLRYDSYPYQKFGTYEARVKTISRTTVSPEDLPFDPAAGVGESVYVVKAELENTIVFVSGEERSLQSGSKFKADLVLEERKIWQWLLGPIRSLQTSM